VPPVDGFYQEVPATTNPLGLRGLGECGNPGLGGAIANAICDALGQPIPGITRLPLTPASIWNQVLRSHLGGGHASFSRSGTSQRQEELP